MPTFSDNPALSPSSSRGFSRFRRNPLLLDLEQRINPAKGGGGEARSTTVMTVKLKSKNDLTYFILRSLSSTHTFHRLRQVQKNCLRALSQLKF